MRVYHCLQSKLMIIILIMASAVFQSYCFSVSRCKAATNKTHLMTATEMEDDTKIKAVWSGMRAALKAKNIDKALDYFAEDAKDTYKYNFDLMKSHLDEISSNLTDIELNEFLTDELADYEMRVEYEGKNINSLVRFIKDKNGNWKIAFF